MTANTRRPRNTDVVVVGGGYAGVMAANRLTQLSCQAALPLGSQAADTVLSRIAG